MNLVLETTATETDYTLFPIRRHVVMISGQIVKCPKCGRAALVKRTVDTISYIHLGNVEVKQGYVKVVSAAEYCRISVYGRTE